MAARNYNNTAPSAITSSFIDATTTTVALDKVAGFPAPPFTAAIGRGTAYEEVVLVTAINALTATITRGYDSTVAQSHAVSSTFEHVAVARDFAEANTHVNAIGGVHGVVGTLVGLSDAQVLTNKTLTAPTITSPTITGLAVAVASSAPAPLSQVQSIAATAAATAAAPAAALTAAASFTLEPGFSLGGNASYVRYLGRGLAYAHVNVVRTGAPVSISQSTTGNIGNTKIATTASAFRPYDPTPMATLVGGRVATGYLATDGGIWVSALGGSGDWGTGEEMSLAVSCYLLNNLGAGL